jgi:long-chain acyl-CoA synthetase
MTPTDVLPILPALIAERLTPPRPVTLAERRGGQTLAFSSVEVHRAAAAVAHALRARGIVRGDRVAIAAHNRVEWLLADFGILYAGCVVVPLFATTGPDQIAYILTDSEAKLVFTDDAQTAAAIRLAVPHAPPIVTFEGEASDGFAAFLARGEALHDADPAQVATFSAGIGLDEMAVLIYTSGTTGTPKGVMLSHRNLVSNVVDAYDPVVSEVKAGETALSVLPFAHIYEHTNALGYLSNHAVHYVTTPERLMDDLRALRPSHIAFVPRIFERLLAAIVGKAREAGGLRAKLVPWALEVGTAYERARRDGKTPSPALRARFALAHALVLRKIKPTLGLDRLDYFVSGSAALHRDTALTLASMGIEVIEGYGLSETSPVITVNRPSENVLGSVGKAIRNVEITIGEDGEIFVKGPNVMLGYYHVAPEDQPFTPAGWFKTGDIGRLEDGRLYITDRKRELFKTSGGKWVSPARIETALKRSIYLAQAMAFGEQRPHPCVLVAPNWSLLRGELGLPDETPTAAIAANEAARAIVVREVLQHTADLGKYERVRRVAVLPRDLTIEDGELSPTLKVKRRVVEQRYAALIETAYAEDLHARESAAT